MYRTLFFCLVVGFFSGIHAAHAEPRILPAASEERIEFDRPTLAPFAYTRFCLRHAKDCSTAVDAKSPVPSAQADLAALDQVNREVNRAIVPKTHTESTWYDSWQISPPSGDCNDYAVTKRHKLLQRGWAPGALLLAEVITSWGQHHLVLVVRTENRDLVLDNLSASVRDWSDTEYDWVRIQSPTSSTLWTTIRPFGAKLTS